jgi:hypothetical protein
MAAAAAAMVALMGAGMSATGAGAGLGAGLAAGGAGFTSALGTEPLFALFGAALFQFDCPTEPSTIQVPLPAFTL